MTLGLGNVGRAGSVGFGAADRLGGGPGNGALVAVVEVDGDGGVGDVGGDDAVGVAASERDLLSGEAVRSSGRAVESVRGDVGKQTARWKLRGTA